jgi:hypothetical protein
MASQAWIISFGIAIGATALEFYKLVLVAACLIAPYWAQNHFATLACNCKLSVADRDNM